MIALNYVYFLILTFLLFRYVGQKRVQMLSPFSPKHKLLFSGTEFCWVMVFSTGLLALAAPAGLDLMAIRLFMLELLCLLLLGVSKTRAVLSAPAILYIVFLLWLVIGLCYTDAPAYGARVILKYLYPLLFMLAASAVVRCPEVMMKAAQGARWVAAVSIIIIFIPYASLLFPGVFWYSTARAIHYISMSMLSLALFFYAGRKTKDLIWTVLFFIPCLYWVFRTSIMGTSVALMAFSFIRYKIKALPVIAAIATLGVCSIFFVPSIKEKMFYDGNVTFEQVLEGKIDKDNVNSNARFSMWEYFEGKFYRGHELCGSGTGTCQQHFYTHFIFGGIKVMHSDIVQMKCDNGQIALALYYFSILCVFLHCLICYGRYRDPWIKVCAITAGSSIVGMACTMYSDNVVNYTMCTLSYPFGFYGMMLGLMKGKHRR